MSNFSVGAQEHDPAERRTVAVLITVTMLVISAIAILAFTRPKDIPKPIAVAVAKLPPPIPPPQEVFGKPFLRVLLVGLDYDYSPADQETSAHSRSDIIMALGVDLVHHRLNVVSVPRDMEATLPDGTLAKINQAQSQGGIAESERVVASWLGVPKFDRHVVLRIDTSKNLVDALGGIDVDVKNADALRGTGANGPLNYDDSWGHLHVHLQPGLQHLDGTQAVAYARFRHDWCSDPCRIMRQHQVIAAIVDRVQHQRIGLVMKLGPLLDTLHRDVETNFTTGEEVSLAYAFRNINAAAVDSQQIPYAGETTLPAYGDTLIANQAEKAKIVKRELAGMTTWPDPTPEPVQAPI